MTPYNPPLVSVVVLDYNRPKEAAQLMESLRANLLCASEVVWVSNGGEDRYVSPWFENGLITRWVRNRANWGCGLGMRLAAQACMTPWVILCQVDQFLRAPLTDALLNQLINELRRDDSNLYMDLAGNQGNGRYSERAHLINRERYLSIPGLDQVIGGPGPYADHRWTEQHVQEYMAAAELRFLTLSGAPLFVDNGKWSRRSYPDGAETLHSTDEKRLFILKPFTKRLDGFPNLKLNDAEWELALSGRWPAEGLIPEADKAHSFVHWKD